MWVPLIGMEVGRVARVSRVLFFVTGLLRVVVLAPLVLVLLCFVRLTVDWVVMLVLCRW